MAILEGVIPVPPEDSCPNAELGIGSAFVGSRMSGVIEKRILFVGREQPLWNEVQQRPAEQQNGWGADLAFSAQEALAMAAATPYSAVVADVQLCDSTGLDLLDEVMHRHPKTVRVVLSEPSDTSSTVTCVGRGHTHILQPCDANTLIHALDQALSQETWLPTESVKGLIAEMRHVPSPPVSYFQVLDEIQSPDASVERVAQLIAQDPAITAKVLQLANSAVFGLRLEVIQPLEAVAYLGLDTTKAIVLLAHTFSSFSRLQFAGFSVESLWHHSVLTGHLARLIAEIEQSGQETLEQSMTAGLLHDIGKLLLAANLPYPFVQTVAAANEQGRPVWEAEREAFGASHAELGAYLLGIWRLPSTIVHAVALHHTPLGLVDQGFTPLTAVHVADVLAHEISPDGKPAISPELNMDYLGRLQLQERLEEWRSKCALETSDTAV